MSPLDLTILITVNMDFKGSESVFGKYFFLKNKIIVDYRAESQVCVPEGT